MDSESPRIQSVVLKERLTVVIVVVVDVFHEKVFYLTSKNKYKICCKLINENFLISIRRTEYKFSCLKPRSNGPKFRTEITNNRYTKTHTME